MKPFFFKQFVIHQDKTAMKVGTDGVLLGAWVGRVKANKILDIGTGTGLIALMQAQKNSNAEITAIEIDEDAFLQASKNIAISSWKDTIKVIHSSLQNFQSQEKFDLIISNPPFFNNSFKSDLSSRNIARQTESLTFNDLLKHTASLLSKNGKACFILPYQEKENFLVKAGTYNMFLNKILLVKGNINTEVKRILVELSFYKTDIIEDLISIEISRHNYTKDYINLVQDFYIKM